MSNQLVGEVRLFAGATAPEGWAICDGRLLNIQDYLQLYSVIGTTYGGDGRETFAIPNVTGRVAIHPGYRPGLTARRLGETGGAATVRLDERDLPVHDHPIEIPAGRSSLEKMSETSVLAASNGWATADEKHANQVMSPSAIGRTGSSRAHNNMQPYLALNYIIALVGTLPEPD